ncbi:HNH endonuclease [Armatimonas sp.]|uniref:HNH endonuclease n=1 Tax=Armatimonas sp. TaxID=1872638 RepID=UPI003750D51F
MALLYYWHPDNYRRDLDMGAGFHLNQSNPLLHSLELGDSLWAFTRNKSKRYVLVAELVIKAKTQNPHNFRYGSYRVWGDLKKSRYFLADDDAPRVEQIIRSLSIRTEAKKLGQSFQGHAAVRAISEADHQVLVAAAQALPLEPRARILPEERLEAAVLLGDEEAVRQLLVEEPSGVAEARAAYLFSQAPTRNRQLVKELQKTYDGKCQLCGWNPMDEYGHWLCHGHHIHWLSRGGDDDLRNLLLVCPNHHGAIHACDAHLDYKDFTFNFGTRVEKVELNLHL